jgi:putative ATPase
MEENLPLALRMRPKSLKEFVGQEHILSKDKLLYRTIITDRISSLILFGPPGTGKTALAHIIKNRTNAYFQQLNAVTSGVMDIKRVVEKAKEEREKNKRKTILFIDEIHRFNRAQQDALLPSVEENLIILIGSTTYNPFFYIIPPLLSRSQVFELFPLKDEDIRKIINNALQDKERGYGNLKINISNEALEHLILYSEGDARRALNALEIGVLSSKKNSEGVINIDIDLAKEIIQKKVIGYDRKEEHYNTISAFIKSMRGSDPDATLYWLAKMIQAGEDPRFIARRIIICASEDVGNADPRALVVATSALEALERIGMPEGKIPLAQAAIYVASAPKSNASYLGIKKALEDVEKERLLEIPNHLKEAGYKGAKRLHRGEGYLYVHDFKDHFVKQDYLSKKKRYYYPTEIGYEKKIKEYLERLKKI